jgi:diguanylate cyclase (GGDEF)-like protein/PAS domain S-box-containing protein
VANRILWLDDGNHKAEITGILPGGVYEVEWVSDREEALSLLERGSIDVFVADMSLYQGDGLALIRQIVENVPGTSCLALYDASDPDAALAALREGAAEVSQKPVSRETLSFALKKALERRHLAEETQTMFHRLQEKVDKITLDLEKANRHLQRMRHYLDNLLNSSVDSVLTTSTDLHITYVNQGVTHMLGYVPSQLMGVPLEKLLRGGASAARQLQQILDKGPIQNYETELLHKDGRFIPVMASLSQVRNPAGKALSVLMICKDITEQKHLENALKEKMITDDLTGLFNQRYFYERLTIEIERAHRQNHPLSLLLFDVDHFKEYNDTHGHLAGDRVLQAIGAVVRESTRGYVDIGCRYGGDEFTIILPETGLEHARNIAERIRTSFEARQFDRCTLSVGLMTYHRDTTAESFIRFADEMMYLAKRSGGNRVYVYDQDKNQFRMEK